MDLSLDEIIKRKRIGVKPVKRNFPLKRTIARPGPPPVRQSRLIDARNKIIQKNRSRIRDAREKLSHRTNGDARLRLLRKKNGSSQPPSLPSNSYRPSKKMSSSKHQSPYPPKAIPISVPRGYIDYDNMEMEEDYDPLSMSLRRTVHNDMAPPFGYAVNERPPISGSSHGWANDPFDVYEMPMVRRPDIAESRREVRNMSPDILPPRKGILRPSRQASPPMYSRRFTPDEHSHLSYEMRTRLERAPDPHASVGIFANPIKKTSSSQSNLPTGYRIVVSNLHTSVTQSDIKELFEDIGQLIEARLVRPGVAEVIFKGLKDAEKAVDTYHNRQLDGQPMKCLLVHPRASNKPTAPALTSSNLSSSLSSRSSSKTPLEIDIDALHKVLFRRH